MNEELTDDALTADFRVWQRRRGHRYALDDVLTAYEALRARPEVGSALDLGTGLGSVLLLVAWKRPAARLVGLEAQPESLALARDNVRRNGIEARVALRAGDLRDRQVLDELPGGPFDLVTGTPPYFPPGTATPSPDAQRAHARHELRGGVEAYLHAAARVLAPAGQVVVCADARRPERVLGPARELGLAARRRVDAVPREGRKPPLFTVWTLVHAEEGSAGDGPAGSVAASVAASVPGAPAPERAEPFVARDADGRRTRAYLDLRAFFGLARSPA